MDFAAMIMDMVIQTVSEEFKEKPKKAAEAGTVYEPAPVEGFGDLVKKAVGTSLNMNASDEEMDLFSAVGNFFGK